MDTAAICAAFDLGVPVVSPSYVARGELGRVSRLETSAGVWAVKEIELFAPTVDEADANVEFQETMLDAGLHLPRPRRTVDGHALFANVRVYEWLDMTPIRVGAVDDLVAAALARAHAHAPRTDETPDPWYCEVASRHDWDALLAEGASTWWAPAVRRLAAELIDLPRPHHSPAHVCHLDVCPENVFVCDGRVTIIDWENAGPAATVQDLGSTLWDFFRGDVASTRAFVDHYRRHGGPIEHVDAAVFDTARVVQANLVDFHARRALDPMGTPESHARAERALRSCLARPLTRDVVDAVVAGRA